VYSAQSKTYPRVFVLAPVESPLVNAQNFYTAITRAQFGARLWTNNVEALVSKLERQSGEKTSSSEGLGRMKADRVDAFSRRQGTHLAHLKAEQERVRAERRDRALARQLDRRQRPPAARVNIWPKVRAASRRCLTDFLKASLIVPEWVAIQRLQSYPGPRRHRFLNPNPPEVPNDKDTIPCFWNFSTLPCSAGFCVPSPHGAGAPWLAAAAGEGDRRAVTGI
jgi:hypothetical protein